MFVIISILALSFLVSFLIVAACMFSAALSYKEEVLVHASQEEDIVLTTAYHPDFGSVSEWGSTTVPAKVNGYIA